MYTHAFMSIRVLNYSFQILEVIVNYRLSIIISIPLETRSPTFRFLKKISFLFVFNLSQGFGNISKPP